ncbi:hypothetical protein NPIL_10181 [Nephila pilipes]|uniref:Uncharacterized protein n=1 Tax=Nephila pilipes TaxID=299642 RepID=A0A8X6UBV4_NEPPI|nr:hypothetical protein NPIL_10181 [Nephila pilipes]
MMNNQRLNQSLAGTKVLRTQKGGKKSLGEEVHPLSPGGKDQDSFEKEEGKDACDPEEVILQEKTGLGTVIVVGV